MSFFSSIAHFFSSIFHAVTGGGVSNLLHKALTGINLVEPLLVLGVQAADPSSAGQVRSVVDEIRDDMGKLSDVIAKATNPNDTTKQAEVGTALRAINGKIQQLLAAGHIKNRTLQSEIEAGLGELQAVVISLTPSAAPVTATAAPTPKA